ncbi:unnamed protein product, partial [Dibothriocephalus latus]
MERNYTVKDRILPKAKIESVEVRIVNHAQGCSIAAISVHWPSGHVVSGRVNISTVLTAPTPPRPPATMILPLNGAAESDDRALRMDAAGIQKSLVSSGTVSFCQPARRGQKSTEASLE